MLPKYVLDNIAQENYLRNVGPEYTYILSQENRLFQMCLVTCFLNGYNITEQSWLFLFNVGSRVSLRLVGQQWTEAHFDWNTDIKIVLSKHVVLTMWIINIIINMDDISQERPIKSRMLKLNKSH